MYKFNDLVEIIMEQNESSDLKTKFMGNVIGNIDFLRSAGLQLGYFDSLKDLLSSLDENPKFYEVYFKHTDQEQNLYGDRKRPLTRVQTIKAYVCGDTRYRNKTACNLYKYLPGEGGSVHNYFFASVQGTKDMEKMFSIDFNTAYGNPQNLKNVYYNNYVKRENKVSSDNNLKFKFIVDLLSTDGDINDLNGGPNKEADPEIVSTPAYLPKTAVREYKPVTTSTKFQ